MINVTDIPLSLYIHWPWCVRKCPYCDFNSHKAPKELDSANYVDALLRDLTYSSDAAQGRVLGSIFVGGGTPSLMPPAQVGRLLEGVSKMIPIARDCEITMEANPGTVDEARFAGFRSAGVNRLSLGVQSFNDEALKRIGRIHTGEDAFRAVTAALAHFDNVNLDLMFALPGETIDSLSSDLHMALTSGVTHLSLYQLTIESGTAFAKRLPQGLPDDDLAADMADLVLEFAQNAGFEHYEVSGYARPGRRCRHNLNYWTFGDYLAAGAGAHAKLTYPNEIYREARMTSPLQWREAIEKEGHGIAQKEVVSSSALPFEFMLNVLRLTEGVPATLFAARTGLALETIATPLQNARQAGLLSDDADRIVPTEKGRLFLSDLQEYFL